jgi:hypothetical protein
MFILLLLVLFLLLLFSFLGRTYYLRVRFEVFAAVIMKNAVFWGVTPFRSCVNRLFGGKPIFYPEDGGDTFVPNVGLHKIYTAPHPRRRHSLLLECPTISVCFKFVGHSFKIFTVSVLVTVDRHINLIYLYATCHMSSSRSSLVSAVKPTFHAAATLSLYIKTNKNCMLFHDICKAPSLTDAGDASTSRAREPAMFSLLIVRS